MKCVHILGYLDDDDSNEFVEADFTCRHISEQILKNHINLFKFCPECGLELIGLAEQRVAELKEINKKIKQEEEKARKAKKAAFDLEVKELAQHTGLDKLPEGEFVVKFSPLGKYDKEFVLSGEKNLILRNCVNVTSKVYYKERDNMQVESIYKMPSIDKFLSFVKSHGYKEKPNNIVYKTVDDTTIELDYSYDSGVVYINTKDNKHVTTDYNRISIISLGDYLDGDFDLELVVL